MKNETYKGMCDTACYGVIFLDQTGKIEYANEFSCRLMGISTDDLATMPSLVRYLPEKEHRLFDKIFFLFPDIISADQKANTPPLEPVHIEFEKPAANMTMSVLLKISINAIYTDNQKSGYAVWINDITRRKKLLTQLDQAEKLASLATLASGIAHHFNNIIGGVATFADFALSGNNPQAYQRAMTMTIEAAERISNITSSLLTFAEQDSREVEKSNLSDLVSTFCRLIEKSLSEQNIMLETRIDSIPYYEVPGSKTNQVLNNIIDNAREAMPDGGTLSIYLRQENDNIVLSFKDTGVGIDADHLPHIFNPFFTTRGVASDGDASHNSGLGLSVVYGIVKELKGNITAHSTINSGSEFIIRLPINR